MTRDPRLPASLVRTGDARISVHPSVVRRSDRCTDARHNCDSRRTPRAVPVTEPAPAGTARVAHEGILRRQSAARVRGPDLCALAAHRPRAGARADDRGRRRPPLPGLPLGRRDAGARATTTPSSWKRSEGPRLGRSAARPRPRHPGQGRLHHRAVRHPAAGRSPTAPASSSADRPAPTPSRPPSNSSARRPGRTGLLAFTGAYHGMTAGALDASGGATDVRVTRLPYPQNYRCPFGIGGERGRRTRRPLDRDPPRRPQGRRARPRPG